MQFAMPKVKSTSQRVSAAQLRAARAILGWTQTDLACASGVSVRTVKSLESPAAKADVAPLDCRPETAERLRLALERAGVTFAWECGAVAVARRA